MILRRDKDPGENIWTRSHEDPGGDSPQMENKNEDSSTEVIADIHPALKDQFEKNPELQINADISALKENADKDSSQNNGADDDPTQRVNVNEDSDNLDIAIDISALKNNADDKTMDYETTNEETTDDKNWLKLAEEVIY